MPKSMKTNGADGQTRTDDLLITNQQAAKPIHGLWLGRICNLKHLRRICLADARIESIADVIRRNPRKLGESRKSTRIGGAA